MFEMFLCFNFYRSISGMARYMRLLARWKTFFLLTKYPLLSVCSLYYLLHSLSSWWFFFCCRDWWRSQIDPQANRASGCLSWISYGAVWGCGFFATHATRNFWNITGISDSNLVEESFRSFFQPFIKLPLKPKIRCCDGCDVQISSSGLICAGAVFSELESSCTF